MEKDIRKTKWCGSGEHSTKGDKRLKIYKKIIKGKGDKIWQRH